MRTKGKETACGISMAEAHAKRIFNLFHFLPDRFGFGSLWWVEENLWKTTIKKYDMHSMRKNHPGLSVRRIPPASPYETVPLLHGTSNRTKGVQVRGLSGDRDKITYFGKIRPVPISLESFLRTVFPNRMKPILEQDELESLENWLAKRGL